MLLHLVLPGFTLPNPGVAALPPGEGGKVAVVWQEVERSVHGRLKNWFYLVLPEAGSSRGAGSGYPAYNRQVEGARGSFLVLPGFTGRASTWHQGVTRGPCQRQLYSSFRHDLMHNVGGNPKLRFS
jgi:hypothetical protein